MSVYDVYLELHPDGRAMVHVPALPGCAIGAESRDAVLLKTPGAIRAYICWLQRHGERLTGCEQEPSWRLAGEAQGAAPFDSRGESALLPPDTEPLSAVELERHLVLADYALRDLVELTGALPEGALNWQPPGGGMTIGGILEHIARAETWYLSRLLPAGRLPPEWGTDGDLPPLEKLRRVRQAVVGAMRGLDDARLSAVHRPELWVKPPYEPWTARKSLRRLLEHELEHTGQLRELLGAYRSHQLARLAYERAWFLQRLLGLEAEVLAQEPAAGAWTAKDIVAHVAAWDEILLRRAALAAAGRPQNAQPPTDERNAALYQERKEWPLERAIKAAEDARQAVLEVVSTIPDELLYAEQPGPSGPITLAQQLVRRARHDHIHGSDLESFRLARLGDKTGHDAGSKAALLAALRAGREGLAAMACLVPAAQRESLPVAGEWSLAQVLGHIADCDDLAAQQVEALLAGRMPPEYERDVENFNAAHAEARAGQSWEQIWSDLQSSRRKVMALLQGASEVALNDRPAGSEAGSAYSWGADSLDHDLQHLTDLRMLWQGGPLWVDIL
jgi:uncharacterized damage-inducible protein DinB/predicted RNase H-like HicB family nuclease